MTGLRIAFAGTPAFSLPALEALAASRHSLVGVLTQPDRPSGRGRKLTASPVKEKALGLGLPLAQPQTLKDAAGREPLQAWKPDVLVVVAYGLILPREALALPRLGCVNIHASLLPRWRGAAPIQRAILAGDVETGVTIMQMDAGLDTGPMLTQVRTPVGAEDTSGTLHDRLAAMGATALLEALDDMERGTVRAQPQPGAGATHAAKIDKSEALIDWGSGADEIERKIRAFNPWPIAETRFDGEPLRIHAARLAPGPPADQIDNTTKRDDRTPIVSISDQSQPPPGSFLGVDGDALLVRCGRSTLAVTVVQRPGRRPISAIDFANSMELEGRRFE